MRSFRDIIIISWHVHLYWLHPNGRRSTSQVRPIPVGSIPVCACFTLFLSLSLCLCLSLSPQLSALNLSVLVFPSFYIYLPFSLSLSRPLPLFDLLFKQSRLHCLDEGLTWYLWHITLWWQYIHRQWRRHPGTLPYPTCCVYLCACLPVSTMPPNPVREWGLSHYFCWVGGSSRSLPTK